MWQRCVSAEACDWEGGLLLLGLVELCLFEDGLAVLSQVLSGGVLVPCSRP
jgi:hypothetical protein